MKNIPAFWQPIPDDENDIADGMTLRDYFAGKAMQSMLTGYYSDPSTNGWADVDICTSAYRYADAMLVARES